MGKRKTGEGAEGERAGRQEEEVGLPRGQAGLGRLHGQGSARSKAWRSQRTRTRDGRREVGPRPTSVPPPGSSLAVVRRLVITRETQQQLRGGNHTRFNSSLQLQPPTVP